MCDVLEVYELFSNYFQKTTNFYIQPQIIIHIARVGVFSIKTITKTPIQFKNIRKMTKLEMIEFENEEKFATAIKKVVAGEEVFRTYTKDGQEKQVKIISNNRLYLGNNYSININKADNGKVYVSVDYFSAENRIDIAKKKSENL